MGEGIVTFGHKGFNERVNKFNHSILNKNIYIIYIYIYDLVCNSFLNTKNFRTKFK